MISIFRKEINTFFSSLMAYIVIGFFLVALGLVMWVFPNTSILDQNYAQLDSLFSMAPLIFIFLIPAITMKSFADEYQEGTIELLRTKPLSDIDIIGGKYLAYLFLLILILLPTTVYYFSVSQLGSPVGNIDSGAILGSYFGLFFLGAIFIAIGLFASSITKNQIIAFVLGVFLCFFCHWFFEFISDIPLFAGGVDGFLQSLGIDYHYNSISRGLIDTRDVVYFVSMIAFFLLLNWISLQKRAI